MYDSDLLALASRAAKAEDYHYYSAWLAGVSNQNVTPESAWLMACTHGIYLALLNLELDPFQLQLDFFSSQGLPLPAKANSYEQWLVNFESALNYTLKLTSLRDYAFSNKQNLIELDFAYYTYPTMKEALLEYLENNYGQFSI